MCNESKFPGKFLDKDDWLAEAKKCPVGHSRRVYHKRESRPNLVVRNLSDRWTAWCHACHKGGQVLKELVQVQHQPLPKQSKRGIPSTLYDPFRLPTSSFQRIVMHLHEKHMSLEILKPYCPQYSPSDDRLVLFTPQGVLGRDLSGKSPAKWYSYTEDLRYAVADKMEYDRNVLTEDFYSAAKISKYTAARGIACLGTRNSPELTLMLLNEVRPTSIMLDGDDAGVEGTNHLMRSFGVLGLSADVVNCTWGIDPKDIPPDGLIALFGEP